MIIISDDHLTTIASSILLWIATAFSAGIMWQALNFSGSAGSMTGLFMLPFANRETTAMSLLCACNGCFTVTAWYTMTKKKKLLPIALLWCGAVLLSIFFVRKIVFLTYSYTCCDCGYVENWVETQSERDEIKRALH